MNWFKYRLPNSSEIISGGSVRLVKGFAEGFVIAPFADPEQGIMTIPYDVHNPDVEFQPEDSVIPTSTSRNDFEEEVRTIIQALGSSRGKTVAARAIRHNIHIDLAATFNSLCSAYPDAFVFTFSTPTTGTWIGATPELLLRKEGDFLSTMALAGTRPRCENDKAWDEKNRDEQAMVAEFITNTLAKQCGTVTIGKTYTKKAGPVEHICTPIYAYLPVSELADEYEESYRQRLRRILTALSPTPAVCGSNRSHSLELIRKCEGFKREMYGGFCGPNGIEGVTAFFVNLRSAKVAEEAMAIYAGGGITALSSPENEWKETEIKSRTIINNLKTSEK